MLLQTLGILGNGWCSNPLLITRFMRGVFISKPPLPKYKFTWDVSCVLKCLASWYPLETLSLKKLTLKLTALIALATAPRAQTLVSLNLNYMKVLDASVVFYFPNLLKTSQVGKNNSFSLELQHFKDEKLCVFHTLLYYIKVTKNLRNSDQLLVSFVSFNSVTSSTIARWLKTVLKLSGIDVEVFTAHSFRSASVSAAYKGSCSVKNILKTAGWKSDGNFYRFYHRTAVSNKDVSFMKAVFSQDGL
jgi:Phage integrase family